MGYPPLEVKLTRLSGASVPDFLVRKGEGLSSEEQRCFVGTGMVFGGKGTIYVDMMKGGEMKGLRIDTERNG